MNVGAGLTYPANALSNFSPHPFELDGVKCNSMEGFLQSLKFKEPAMQEYVCTLVGKTAKFKGKNKKWWKKQVLYWKGVEYQRQSKAYQNLLDRAYNAMYNDSDSFRRALKAAGNAVFTHTIGKSDNSQTVLTKSEFCNRLMTLKTKALDERN